MFAYHLPGVHPLSTAGHPVAQRIQHAGPWQASSWRGGAALTFRSTGKPFNPDDYGHPVPIAGGCTFFPPAGPVEPAVLRRESLPPGQPLLMISGVTLNVPRAETAPSFLVWDGDGLMQSGEPAQEWARLAWQAWDTRENTQQGQKMTASDALLALLTLRAVQASYRVTEEALSHLRWITTGDVGSILAILWGLDPKAVRLAADTSKPAPQDGAASRDLLPPNGTPCYTGPAGEIAPPSSAPDEYIIP